MSVEIKFVDEFPGEDSNKAVMYADLEVDQCFKFNNCAHKANHLRIKTARGHRSLEDGSNITEVEPCSLNGASSVTLYDVQILAKERK